MDNNWIYTAFHKYQLNKIKEKLKPHIKFISFLRRKDEFFIRVILENENGGKDTINFELGVTPNELTEQDYEKFAKILINKTYERS